VGDGLLGVRCDAYCGLHCRFCVCTLLCDGVPLVWYGTDSQIHRHRGPRAPSRRISSLSSPSLSPWLLVCIDGGHLFCGSTGTLQRLTARVREHVPGGIRGACLSPCECGWVVAYVVWPVARQSSSGLLLF